MAGLRLPGKLLAGGLRHAAAALLLGGTALLLTKPLPTSPSSARGHISHHPSAEARHYGYEVKDLSAKGLGFILAGLGLSAGSLVAIVFGMIALFQSWDAAKTSDLLPEQTARIESPPPHLQREPEADLRREQGREDRLLQSYAWLDPAHTRAHVPIERAMQMLVGQPLDAAQ